MKVQIAAASLITLFAAGAALAQTTITKPPPEGPTVVQCNQGYKEGMNWTRDEFTKACAALKAHKKP